MLKSMTGFGRAEQTVGEKTFLVEVKALNGKQFELQVKLPPLLKSYEFDIRNILQENLGRGTIDCYINIKQNGTTKPVTINTELIKAYYTQIHQLAGELDIDTNSVLAALLRLPEVVLQRIENINAQEEAILALEPNRKKRIKDEILQLLEENVGKENIDNNRMEQELIYYMEKIDIHEEQIRLKQHCEYFREIMNGSEEELRIKN
jgi:uncharacterized protein YicC (UPF0701 family)